MDFRNRRACEQSWKESQRRASNLCKILVGRVVSGLS